jgi:nucleotide-binding universal stress UspA family protein
MDRNTMSTGAMHIETARRRPREFALVATWLRVAQHVREFIDERLARLLKKNECKEEPVTQPHPIQVVVAYDFSPSSEQALARAIEVAARAPQHVLHIVAALDSVDRLAGPPLKHVTHEDADAVRRSIIENVTKAFAGRETAAEVQFFVHARIGKPAVEILEVATDVGADLIFIGSHGKTGVERLLLGSVSERVVREAKCPVLVVRPKTYADVDLLRVTRYDHERTPHREPHSYTYTNRQVLLRPNDWPLS